MKRPFATTYAFAALLLAGALAGSVRAAVEEQSVEDFPRHVYNGPNGVKVTLVHYAEQNWTEVDPVAVFADKENTFKEVCFEAKFEGYVGPTGLKPVGVNSVLQFEDREKRKAAPELKALDNIWVCGTLDNGIGGRGPQMTIYDVIKLPPDGQRFENRFQILERANKAQGLIDLGYAIDRTVRGNKEGGMQGYERLIGLRDKAWMLAIAIKEKELRPRDANAMYEIATLYQDLLHRNAQYRTWVLKTLETDPDHGNAGRDAENILKMGRVGDKWMTNEEIKNRELRIRKETEEALNLQKRHDRESAELRAQEIANRAANLLEIQSALRTNDAGARVGALATLGDRIKESLDPGFGLEGVDILANLNGDSAIVNGLDRAAKSGFIEVRQHVYATLVWRAAQSDGAAAFDVLSNALRNEKAKEAAQTASDALAAAGGKAATQTLINGLESSDPGVCEALIGGLKKITGQPLQKREEWQAWWANKSN